jgi:hypothetical protein
VQPLSEVFFKKVLARKSLKNGAKERLHQVMPSDISLRIPNSPLGQMPEKALSH